MTEALEELRLLLTGQYIGRCPACLMLHGDNGTEGYKICSSNKYTPGSGCGHVYIGSKNGVRRHMTKAELEEMRRIDAKMEGEGRRRQSQVVSTLIG